ncbi:MAG: hypothetical protein GX887_05445 [Firmicutes bacterium]|nr:hypothetical protein [Bacillota bacterium]
MVLYTVYPLETVLEGYAPISPEYLELDYGTGCIIFEPLPPHSGRIVRIISSQPQDYLNPQLQPGAIISFDLHGKITPSK